MSIHVLRDGLLTQRRNDRDASIRRRSSRLRALNAVTQALTSRVGLPHALQTDFDSAPTDAEEAAFLDQYDITKGGRFSDSLFPFSLEAIKTALTGSFAPSKSDPKVLPTPNLTTSFDAVDTDAGAPPVQSQSPSVKSVDRPDGDIRDQSAAVDSQPKAQIDNASSTALPTTIAADSQQPQSEQSTTLDNHPALPPSSPESVKIGATDTDGLNVGDVQKAGFDVAEAKEDLDGDTRISDVGAGVETATVTQAAPSETLVPDPRTSKNQSERPHDTTAAAKVVTDSGDANLQENQTPTKLGREQAAPATPVDRSQRMQTRVSSGAMRQKSVAEIMQESPRSASKRKPPTSGREMASDSQSFRQTPSRVSRESMPPPPLPPKSALTLTSDPLEDDLTLPLDLEAYAVLSGAADDPNRDYLEPLYRIQAQDPPNGRSLGELLHKASKAISTADQLTCYRERQDHRILKRVYGLQYANHWSLRQMQPCPEPSAPKTHWDHVIAEAKWMRTDFRQERKEKKMLAKFLAQRCAEWVAADASDRVRMQVKARQPEQLRSSPAAGEAPQSPAATHVGNSDAKDSSDEPVPELDPSNKEDHSSPITELGTPKTPQYAIVPDSIFSALNLSESTQHLLESEEFVKAIHDLPLYAPFDDEDAAAHNVSTKVEPSAVPLVSKFSSDKIITKTSSITRKRSRYDYEGEDDNSEDFPDGKRPRASQDDFGLRPEQADVALFDVEHRQIKERLRATNTFRPPSEFPMPSEKFYEWRLASHWIWEDDQKLRKTAKDYSFNWSLVSDQMALPSHFHGAADRRTPWECFERWVELETLPSEMRKTVYFRTWGQRLESAGRLVDARYQAQLQLHAQTSNPTPPPLKRRTMPTRVDRRKTGRYLHLIDAMRKLARKREQQQHKQNEAQKVASMRKQSEPTQAKTNVHTPQEFSRLRHERDVAMQVRNERMREAMLAQQKAAQMQRNGQITNQQALLAAQQQRQGSGQMQQTANAQVAGVGHTQGQVSGQQQQHHAGVPVQSRNGQLGVPQMGMQGNVPQAQMQANMRSNGTGHNQMSQEQIQRMAMQAQLKGNQMQNVQQMKQYQQQLMNAGANLNMNGMMNGQMSNNQAAMLAALQSNQNGVGNMQHLGGQMNTNGNASVSPNMPPPNGSQPKQLSSGHIPAIAQIKHSLQAAHPQATPQQIEQMANEQMKRHIQTTQARQNAVNAASGNYGNNQMAFQQQNTNGQQANGFNNMNGPSPSAQQYSQLMRARLLQQQQQTQQQQSQQQIQGQGQNIRASASPLTQQASPANMHSSPVTQHAIPNMPNGMNLNVGVNGQQRPPSRNATPQMARIPSNGGMVSSPGMAQGSPRPQMVKQG